MRIVFMGTPDLAAHCLEQIIQSGFSVVAVVTAPDKPAGRGRKLRQSPVKQLAIQLGIPVLQPLNLKSTAFVDQLKTFHPDLQVVVAFRMLPEVVWSLPPKGTFNMHASLLPNYRGAAPINWVLINGETMTGVTTFMLDHKIDTGQILFRKEIPIEPDETAGTLHEKIKPHASDIIIKTIIALNKGDVDPVPQSELCGESDQLKTAPKIYKDDCRIEWNRPGQDIVNLIRGLSPLPGAFCDLKDGNSILANLKIFEATAMLSDHGFSPGTLLSDNKTYVYFAASDGLVKVHRLQIPGKKSMETQELLRGFQFEAPVRWEL